MHKEGDEIHVTDTEASGGSKEGVVRWVLLGGTLLVILLLSVTWITGALTQGDIEEEATVSGEIRSTEDDGDGTDSIIGTDADVGSTQTELGDTAGEGDQTTTENGIEVIEN
ncbi:hypothetical protein [Erythrobacter sp. SD-21]|uniref:hypothetical protein n=1 Tax=Erythrobacter sp. SD-21 TaxID=161528 RepID=UPI000153F08D|nr:hypothetical protein [Erythrobacter sp. SD-21]EDL49247.1 2,3,4,5-tetrahydropyridine-2-carboxylate N-succinyltransferase [Erythrobacter sp. SD-21]